MEKSLTAVLCALGLCLTNCSRTREKEKPPAAVEVPAGKAAPVELDTRIVGWVAGQRYQYSLQMTSKISLGGNGTLYDFDLVGKLDLDVVDVTSDTATIQVAIGDGKFLSRIPSGQPELDKVASELNQPCFLETKGGLVAATDLPPDLHPMVAAVYRSVGATLQFARAQGSIQPYTATEYDTTGGYVAQYSKQARDNSWRKTKVKYLGLLGQKDDATEVIPTVVQSRGDVDLLEDGRPGKVSIADELLMRNAQTPIHSYTQISLVAQSTYPIARTKLDWKVLRARTVKVAANSPYESARDRDNLDDAKIGDLTFDKVAEQLLAIVARSGPSNRSKDDPRATPVAAQQQVGDESKLFVALGAILKREPNAIEHAVRKIQTQSPISELLIDGLGSADTSDAQRALVRIAQTQTYDDKTRARALISLSRSERPTQESIKALQLLAASELLGTQALYGLGAYCRVATAAGDKQMATSLGEYLIRRLSESSRSEAKLIVALRAIGNSGYAPALPKVAGYLTDQREQLRADAVRALAAIDAPEVDRKLVERLSEDSSKHVKLAAIEGMLGRKPTDELVQSLIRATASEDSHVRYRAVEMMIRWIPKRSDLKQNIEIIAKNDVEPKIRELARAAL